MSSPVTISLNAHLDSELNWKSARMQAIDAMMNGLKILWQIDLGLFSALKLPLSNQTQFLSLTLALEHFRDTLWKEFYEHTAEVGLYSGEGDFSQSFVWDDEQVLNFRGWLQDRFQDVETVQKELGLVVNDFDKVHPKDCKTVLPLFCRDVAAEYLQMLANRMPDGMSMFAKLDLSKVEDPLLQAQLINPEYFGRVALKLEGCLFNLSSKASVGVCLPTIEMCRPSQFEGLRDALGKLAGDKVSFKLIPEEVLITEWDGLDYLYYVPSGLSFQGKRKLQGFCAAGGMAVSVQGTIGLANETTFALLHQ